MMHVGDVMGTGAAHLICGGAMAPSHELAAKYYKDTQIDPAMLVTPEIIKVH